MGKARALRNQLRLIPRALWALLAFQVAMVALLILSTAAFFSVGDSEIKRAIDTQQRVVMDAKTGVILSPLAPAKKPKDPLVPAYDVAPPPKKTTEKKPEPNIEEAPSAPENTPPQEKTAPPPADAAISSGLDMSPAPEISPVARSNRSLIPAPAPEVSDITEKGILPKIGGKNLTPAKLYAKRYVWPKEDAPAAISILISGLGVNPRSMQAALTLPDDVSFAFTPYGENVVTWVEYARNAGHEVWLDMPTQTEDFPRTDPGPYGIFKGLEATEVTAHLQQAMMQYSGYVGLALPLNQAVLPEAAVAVTMLEETSKRGLRIAVPASSTALSQLAHLKPHMRDILLADSIIDSTPSEAFIRARLAKLEEQALENGHVFAVASDTPLTLRLIAEWSKTLKAKKIVLVPVSALYSAPEKEK